jgi:hypothetical protein
MTLYEWSVVVLTAVNVVGIPAMISFVRGQRQLLKDEIMRSGQRAIDAHDKDPLAHGNHDGVVKLEQKMDELISKIGELTVTIARLDERLKKDEPRRRR